MYIRRYLLAENFSFLLLSISICSWINTFLIWRPPLTIGEGFNQFGLYYIHVLQGRKRISITCKGNVSEKCKEWLFSIFFVLHNLRFKPFSSSCIRWYDDWTFPVSNVFSDPFQHSRLSIQIVHWYVKETLKGRQCTGEWLNTLQAW